MSKAADFVCSVAIPLLFPDFSLTEQESQFLETYKKVSQRKMKEPIPSELATQSGMVAQFLKACIEVANRTDKPIATAAFITAILEGQIITLPLLHSECQAIIKRVSKQQELLGYYEVDKAKRQIQFIESDR